MDIAPIESISELEAKLDRLLADATSRNRTNVFNVAELRRWLAETHRDVEADERAHGATSAGSYWELVMADWSLDEPAMFALAVWRTDQLTIFVGAGQKETIHSICNRFTAAEVDELFSSMEKAFELSGHEVRVGRGLAEFWVATGDFPSRTADK